MMDATVCMKTAARGREECEPHVNTSVHVAVLTALDTIRDTGWLPLYAAEQLTAVNSKC